MVDRNLLGVHQLHQLTHGLTTVIILHRDLNLRMRGGVVRDDKDSPAVIHTVDTIRKKVPNAYE